MFDFSNYFLCTGKDFSTKLTWDLQRLVLIHVSKSRQESTCIYCSDAVKSVSSDDSRDRQQTNTPCAAKYVCGFCKGIAPLLGLFLLSFLKLINFSLCLNVFCCQLSDERCGVDKGKQQRNSKGRLGTGAVVLLLIITIAAYCLLTIIPPTHKDFSSVMKVLHLVTGSSSLT